MIYDYEKEKGKNKMRSGIVWVVILVLCVVALFVGASIYMDLAQLNEIGDYSGVYITNIVYKGIFAAFSFLAIFIALSLTNIFIKRNLNRFLHQNELPIKKFPNLSIAALLALIGAFMTREMFFQKAINFINSTSFGKQDPIFNMDIGYYVFQRPFLMTLYDFVSTLWVFVILYTLAYYMSVLFLTFNNVTVQDLKNKTLLRHNLINIAIFFVIKAAGYKFQAESILYSQFVDVQGAGYVDVNVWLNYFRAAPFLIIAIVIVSLMFILRGKLRQGAYTIAVFPAIWLLVALSAGAVQGFIVKPNIINLEKPYLKNNIEKTREAYGLDKAKSLEFPEIRDLTPEIINRNLDTKNNIRVVDYKATQESNAQLQSNVPFYNFHEGDIINYEVNGKEIPVLISAREIDKNKLPEKSYVNIMYKYTHGYGVVVNPINKLTSQGQVEYILSGLVQNSIDPKLKVTEPRIYYGELTNDYVIVNAANGLKEIDYDGNQEYTYTGGGGIKMDLLNKLLFATKFGDLNMFISSYVSSDSRLLLNRQVVARAQKALPFLKVDGDPYIIITKDGKLKWVLDAYTQTGYYPYSQYAGNFNYIRNSAKIVVDAYEGSVDCYVIDRSDPIINTYMKAYPNVILDEPLPEDVALHSRYPEYLFKLQTEVMRRYHVKPDEAVQNIDVFYSKQDYWDIAKYSANINAASAGGGEEKLDIEPYYNMIKLPLGMGEKEELILMRPFTMAQKNNMASWLAVRNSNDNYGELILFHFPKNTNIFGPYQVDVKISQIDQISKDISLWNSGGSSVFKGNLLVIPIENSVLYVEPIYIKAAGSSTIPEVREIVVGYQKGEEFRYGIGTNLDAALNDLFEGLITTPAVPTPTEQPENQPSPGNTGNEKIINDIKSKYDELKKQLDDLGKLLEDLNK